ncbi:DUF2573 family protein [Bacillus fonticola]|uniref:DUF2573 family protein n=1 Tax=Bacillus fonticola TaxID=2728853 RepID=UPI001475B4D6|nr:DUF2573 family protein [Bacillus fonticola]
MNKQTFDEAFQSLLAKYTELLLDQEGEDWVEDVSYWALYTHVAKSMPALAKHWNSQYPEAKEMMKEISLRVKKAHEEKQMT